MNHLKRHFQDLFHDDDDPWSYRRSFEERRRHGLMMAMLDAPNYLRAFEPACATGIFTEQLAKRCAEVVAWDGSSTAISHCATVARRCRNVEFTQGTVPERWPAGTFDLIVLSDFLYYLGAAGIASVAHRTNASIRSGGLILVCHWRGEAHDFLTPGGDAVHAALENHFGKPTGPTFIDRRQLISGWTR